MGSHCHPLARIQKGAVMAEKTASEAPVWYSADEASAWANGYNACLDAQPQSPPNPGCSNSLCVYYRRLSDTRPLRGGKT